jgi:tRNA G10  N-methylase Trm11
LNLLSQVDTQPHAIDFAEARSILSNINWSFSASSVSGRTDYRVFDGRHYHWYPATFIPEIPLSLIEVLTLEGGTVYDPFMGIGTTVFQTLMLGRIPYSSEICRVAIDIVHALLALLNPAHTISHIHQRMLTILAQYDSGTDYSTKFSDHSIRVDELRNWFSEKTFNELMYLAYCDIQEDNIGCKSLIRVALSATLKTVCAQDRGWGCIADRMLPNKEQMATERSAFERFSYNYKVLLKDLSETRRALPDSARQWLRDQDISAYVRLVDARQGNHVPSDSVDLIVTSPPYPNMTDYSTSQRLSYYLLGYDPSDDVSKEIGARRKRFASTSIEQYVNMKAALETSCAKLKTGGYACFVMPSFEGDKTNNVVRRRAVQECLNHLLSVGMESVHELNRVLPTRRRQHNQKWATLEREIISIYRKF